MISLSVKITFAKDVIVISFNLLLIIIGEVIFEVRFKFSKYKLTELVLTITFPSVDFPVIKNEPAVIIVAIVPLILTPAPVEEGPNSSNVIVAV